MLLLLARRGHTPKWYGASASRIFGLLTKWIKQVSPRPSEIKNGDDFNVCRAMINYSADEGAAAWDWIRLPGQRAVFALELRSRLAQMIAKEVENQNQGYTMPRPS